MESKSYSLMELAEATGAEARTIRNYIENGLLEGPSSMGRGARYTEEDRQRLVLIRDLREREKLSLKEIRHRLGQLTPQERAAAAESAISLTKGKRKPESAFSYVDEILSSPSHSRQSSLFRRGSPRTETRVHLEVTPDLEIVWKGPPSPYYLAQLERIAEKIRIEISSRKGDRDEEEQSGR